MSTVKAIIVLCVATINAAGSQYSTEVYPENMVFYDTSTENYYNALTENYYVASTENYYDASTENYNDASTENYADAYTEDYSTVITPSFPTTIADEKASEKTECAVLSKSYKSIVIASLVTIMTLLVLLCILKFYLFRTRRRTYNVEQNQIKLYGLL